MVVVKHKPMPKFRVVLVLEKPFVIGARGGLQSDAIREWKERYAGASKMLGAYFDRSCVDPSRLFFTPRHAKGAEWHVEIIAGKVLDIEECERLTQEDMRKESLNNFERVNEVVSGKRGGKEYKTHDIYPFFGKYGPRFDVETFLLDVDPDGDRGPRSNGPGRTHRCPNDDNHGDAGNPEDKGFFCINADDSDKGGAVAKCMHDTCAGLDRIDFVDMICERVSITDAEELLKWVPRTKEDDEEEKQEGNQEEPQPEPDGAPKPQPPPRAYKNYAEAQRAVGNLTKDDAETAGIVARNIGATTSLKATQRDSLKKEWCKRTGMGAKVFEDEAKLGKPPSPGDGEGRLDDDAIAALKELNKTYALVRLENKIRIACEAEAGKQPVFMLKDDFALEQIKNRIKLTDGMGNSKWVPTSLEWLKWPEGRQYDRVVFCPGVKVPPNEYNIWAGFAVKPKKGDWSKLRGHIFDNVCQGNQEHFDFLMTWMAQILQQPSVKMPCSVVLKGKKGTGKSKLFEWFCEILGGHGLKVNDADQILNGFNKHQQGILFMLCEEAVWGGDARAGGKLKDMISSTTMLVTPKGLDSIPFANLMRLAMISNEEWIIPASLGDERRYFVLLCGEDRKDDLEFFGAIDDQMKAGGLEAMAHELMHWQPTMFERGWNVLRKPLETVWQTEQAQIGMPIWDKFFHSIIEAGQITRFDKPCEVEEIPLYEDRPNLLPKRMLLWYYERFCMSTTAGKHKAGDSVLFDRLVDDWLMASAGVEMTAWVNRYALGALEVPVQCIRCPPLSTIKADLKVRKRLTFAPVVVEGDDDAEIRHQIGQVFRDMIEAGVEGAVPLFDSDETIEGVSRFFDGFNHVSVDAVRKAYVPHVEALGEKSAKYLGDDHMVHFARRWLYARRHKARLGGKSVSCYRVPPLSVLRGAL